MGTIYLVHFSRPYKHARHYLGFAEDLDARMTAHRAGNGARLIQVLAAEGIEFVLARAWEGPPPRATVEEPQVVAASVPDMSIRSRSASSLRFGAAISCGDGKHDIGLIPAECSDADRGARWH